MVLNVVLIKNIQIYNGIAIDSNGEYQWIYMDLPCSVIKHGDVPDVWWISAITCGMRWVSGVSSRKLETR